MTIAALLIFCAALAINAGTPGPSIAALVSRVLTNGVRDILPFLAAMWLGEAVWLTVAVTGLSALAHSFAIAFMVIKYLGVAYLLYLAWHMWHAPVANGEQAVPPRRKPLQMFGTGMMVTFGNPKLMVFYLALLPSIIDLHRLTVGGWAMMTVAQIAVLASVDLSWSFAAARAKRLLRKSKTMRIANRTSAGVMTGAAILIAAK